jgi:hypothetical protein
MMNIVKVINHLRERMNNDELGLWFVLAFVYEREQEGVTTKITDLVQSLEFGTGPTVYRKVQQLFSWDLVQLTISDCDMRVREISITEAGLDFMRKLDKTLNEVIAPAKGARRAA